MEEPTPSGRSRPQSRKGLLSSSTKALWFSFTGLLLLMTVIAVDALQFARNLETTSSDLRSGVRRRDRLLDQLRSDIYRSSTVMRDHLLEDNDALAEGQKVELERLYARIDDGIRTYEREAPDEEKQAVRELLARAGSYWTAMAPALGWDAPARRANGRKFLQGVVIPLRTELVDLTRQFTDLNERDMDAAEDRIQAAQLHFQRRVAMTSGGALILGLIVCAMTIRRMLALEREGRARFAEVEDARAELQKLSARLQNAQEEERRSIASELHDEVGQAMSAMLVELGRAEAAQDNATREERIASVRRTAERSIVMIRNIALMLRPSMLDDLGLVAALQWQAREITRRYGLKVKMLTGELAGELPDEYRTCLYRVVQEALNNCAKHARASQARVVVHQEEDGIVVTVQDDGVGFSPDREKGLGLLGMTERIARLGGSFSIDSQPGRGTVLSAHLPLTGDAAAEVKGTS